MTIFDISELLQTRLEVSYMPTWEGPEKWFCSLERVEVKQGRCLAGSFGRGLSPKAAMVDYCRIISNQTIVHNATLKSRTELRVPVLSLKSD